mmetsp:Transcript_42469/g.48253  ORF Transcript_42469/g.48253 Transcript_42469/m.48253 type:complete len:420 (+) Transcript_42469:129-1388(+)|eukprot:CAMPEP_0194132922 /NCGR_PEP_ID=MMETSP0152-20130528/3268_1 /TAXON_ID=1049557 /ORGANISM="Thalassiothrix antarctica, Strain L6-D1" /LENGTH=419 /DNA_ID=CAMNT_0038828119 /DNA_START=85 /DNA_END=1344 /DNA_ORIENTATION=+
MLLRYSLLLLPSLLQHTSAFTFTPILVVGKKSSVLCTAAAKDINVSEFDDIKISSEDLEFNEMCKSLCEERNICFDNIKNARDLASPLSSPLKSNRLYRTGRLSDASDEDIKTLFDKFEVNTIIDLRSPTELKEDKTLQRVEVFGNFTDLVWTDRGRKRDGCVIELGAGEPPTLSKRQKLFSRGSEFFKEGLDDDEDEDDCNFCDEGGVPASKLDGPPGRRERYFVSLMNEFKYVRGTLGKVRKRDIARTVLKSPGALVSKRVRDSVKEPFLDKINDGGLPMLNELLLRFGASGIKYVLDICADRKRHPVIFHCTAGKDRTGMITAIILSLCGVSDEEIVQDYMLSANVYSEMNDHKAMVGALSQRNLNPKTFLGAPPQVMRDTLESIREEYGSVEEYMEWIGFGYDKQEKLKIALMED